MSSGGEHHLLSIGTDLRNSREFRAELASILISAFVRYIFERLKHWKERGEFLESDHNLLKFLGIKIDAVELKQDGLNEESR